MTTTYAVRIEYPVIAYSNEEVTAASPEEAAAIIRERDRDGRIAYDHDDQAFPDQVTITVWDDEAGSGSPVLCEPGRLEQATAEYPGVLESLRAVLPFAHSRAEDLHAAAEASGAPGVDAAWRKADEAVTAAEQLLARLTGKEG